MKREIKTSTVILVSLIIFIITLAALLNVKTGLFSKGDIDKKDLRTWTYNGRIISGAQEIRDYRDNNTCWLMIHGYGSTPRDFYSLIEKLKMDFNDTLVVPRLIGHGTVPSAMNNLSFNDWYSQVDKEYLELDKMCNKVNLVGFSFGGALALKIAENNQINNLYLISPLIKIRYKFIHIIPKEIFIKLFANYVTYSAKSSPAQINFQEGMKEYIGYYSFPLIPLKESLEEIEKVKQDLGKVNAAGILIIHSENDDTVDVESSEIIYKKVNINKKELEIYEKSNHVILVDYDGEDVINKIINFEKENR